MFGELEREAYRTKALEEARREYATAKAQLDACTTWGKRLRDASEACEFWGNKVAYLENAR